MDLIATSTAIENHFNGNAWDRKIGLKLAAPSYEHVVPSMPPPRLLKRKRKHQKEWDLEQ